MKKQNAGVTLIELMIVLVILSIIAAIAIPSYQNYLQRAKRSEAIDALMRTANVQEKYFLLHSAYTSDANPFGSTPSATFDTTGNMYTISAATTNGGMGYKLTATIITSGGQAGDSCNNFTLTHTGQRGVNGGTVDSEIARCWK